VAVWTAARKSQRARTGGTTRRQQRRSALPSPLPAGYRQATVSAADKSHWSPASLCQSVRTQTELPAPPHRAALPAWCLHERHAVPCSASLEESRGLQGFTPSPYSLGIGARHLPRQPMWSTGGACLFARGGRGRAGRLPRRSSGGAGEPWTRRSTGHCGCPLVLDHVTSRLPCARGAWTVGAVNH
jgi:hypothetical protein